MTKLTIGAVAIPLSLLASPALAQSAGGAYVEAQAGWDHLRLPDQTGTTAGVSTSSQRLLYGGGAGYDLSLGGPWIVGVGGNFDWGNRSGCAGSVVATGDQLCSRLVRDFDIGGRIGVKAGATLLYARAAYADTLLRSTYQLAGGTPTMASRRYGAARFGAGVEQGLGDHVFIGAEYRYTNASALDVQHQILANIGFRF